TVRAPPTSSTTHSGFDSRLELSSIRVRRSSVAEETSVIACWTNACWVGVAVGSLVTALHIAFRYGSMVGSSAWCFATYGYSRSTTALEYAKTALASGRPGAPKESASRYRFPSEVASDAALLRALAYASHWTTTMKASSTA